MLTLDFCSEGYISVLSSLKSYHRTDNLPCHHKSCNQRDSSGSFGKFNSDRFSKDRHHSIGVGVHMSKESLDHSGKLREAGMILHRS